MATERIEIVVTEKGSAQAAKNIRSVGSASTGTVSGINLLRRALITLGGAAALRGFVGMLDTLADLKNRLGLVTNGAAQTGAVMNKLFLISKKTRTDFDATGIIFSRTALATQQLGISMQRTLDFTENLNKAVILSGVNAREAKAGLIQLSQGLASNRLSGDELRSVLEQLPFVADIIAKNLRGMNGELGVTRGEFREMAHSGKITTKVIIEAFEKASQELEDKFGKTVPTISQSMSVLSTEVLRLTNVFESNTGITGIFSSLILATANNVETLVRILGAAGLVGVLILVRIGLTAITAQLALLRVAINANPLLKLLSLAANLIVIAVALLTAFADKIQLGTDKLGTLADYMLAAFQLGREALIRFLEPFGSLDEVISTSLTAFESLASGLGSVFKSVFTFLINTADNFIGIFAGIVVSVIRTVSKIPAAFKNVFTQAFNGVILVVETANNKIIDAVNFLREKVGLELLPHTQLGRLEDENEGAFLNLGKTAADGFVEGFKGSNLFQNLSDTVGKGLSSIISGAGGIGAAIGERAAGLTQERLGNEIVKKASEDFALTQLGQAGPDKSRDSLGKTKGIQFSDIIRQLRQETELLKLNSREREIHAAVVQAEESLKRKLTNAERELLTGTLLLNQAYADRAEILDEMQAPQIEMERGIQALNSLFSDGLIDLDQYNRKLRELQQGALALDTTVEGGLKRGLLSIHEQFTNLSQIAEQGLVNAFQGAEDALVKFVQTGKLSFKSLVDSIFEDMTRLAVRSAITGPIAGLLAPSSTGGGAAGALSSLFSFANTGNGGPVAAAASGSGGSGTLGGLASMGAMLGFRNGGDFTVGGSGGPDSQVVAFKGTPGEEVTVNKPGQSGSKGATINFYISTPDVDGFKRSQGQLMAKAQASLTRSSARNN